MTNTIKSHLNLPTTEINLISTKVHCPYVQLPRCLRFLSFRGLAGEEIRITLDHIGFLHYLSELDCHYKSMRTMSAEIGISLDKLHKIKKELSYPCVEIGVPLINISEFRDSNNNLRHQIEVFPHYDKLASYDKFLFDSEEGASRRSRWVNQWSISKGGVLRKTEHGCYAKQNKENLNKENLNLPPSPLADKIDDAGSPHGGRAPKKTRALSMEERIKEEVTKSLGKEKVDEAHKYYKDNKSLIDSKDNPIGWIIAALKNGYATITPDGKAFHQKLRDRFKDFIKIKGALYSLGKDYIDLSMGNCPVVYEASDPNYEAKVRKRLKDMGLNLNDLGV